MKDLWSLLMRKTFFACIKDGFGQRRKTLLNSLTGVRGLSRDDSQGSPGQGRNRSGETGRNLDIEEFAAIANEVAADLIGRSSRWKRLKTFCKKYLKNYIVLLFVIAIAINLRYRDCWRDIR